MAFLGPVEEHELGFTTRDVHRNCSLCEQRLVIGMSFAGEDEADEKQFWEDVLTDYRLCMYCEDFTQDYADQLLELVHAAASGHEVQKPAAFLAQAMSKEAALEHQIDVLKAERLGDRFPALGHRLGASDPSSDDLIDSALWDDDSSDELDPGGIAPNVHPLALVLFGSSSSEAASFEARVVHAAVHAWMEGHLCAPGHPRPGATDESMPSPPVPARNEPQLKAIVDDTLERFDPIQIVAATAYAASLAWVAGENEGMTCRGCVPRQVIEPRSS